MDIDFCFLVVELLARSFHLVFLRSMLAFHL